jgi:Uma2 family endonuclease
VAGASPAHNVIAANVIGELRNRLKGIPCVPYAGDLRVRVDRTGLYAYPDATVICGKPRCNEADVDNNTILNPTLIVPLSSVKCELPLAEIYYNVVVYQPGRHPGPPPE